MKKFSIIEPPSREFLNIALRRYGIDPDKIKDGDLHQEDSLLVSKRYPIFVVADGVTLLQYLLDKKDYPNPSPAGDVARIFCEEFLMAAEERYEFFNEDVAKEVFRIGNEAVGKYNQENGRTKDTVDYWNNDYYAATAAFAVVKDDMVYWGSIGDSFVAQIGEQGNVLFQSPQPMERVEVKLPKYDRDPNDPKAKAKYIWSTIRNGVDNMGKLVGYGVVTGEESANRYLNHGSFEIKQDELLAIFTDGFEDYVRLPEFVSIFKNWSDNLDKRAREFTAIKAVEDPDKFGHERSLIVVSV